MDIWRDKLACIPYLVVISVSEPSHDLDAAFSPNGREQDQRSVGAALNASSVDVMAELGILDAREVANLLKLRTSTVLDLSRRGILPAFKIGKHWRYRRADLIEWIANRGEAG